jgi:mono/diheme cytochrome c family protein
VNSTTRTRRTQLALACLLFALYPLLLGCGPSGPPPTPLNQLNQQQMHGYYVFQSNCARCHDDRDSDSLHGPSMLGVFKRQYLPSGAPANDERVRETILEGHGMMPAIRTMDSQELTDLLAYLHSL